MAQIISVRGALGMNRQIFFAGMGGFDNHEDLVDKHQDLMAYLRRGGQRVHQHARVAGRDRTR